MKLPQLLTRKKLRATTARRALGGAAEMDYEEMSEPNMKLSRALLIVLVLHVVAVAGIIAFNTIKTRQGPPPPIPTESATAKTVPAAPTKPDMPTVVASTKSDEATTVGMSGLDRKSTRLNSSHTVISYAVFCLKKKKIDDEDQ